MALQAVIFDRDNTLLKFDRQAVGRLEAQVAAVAPQIQPGAATAHWMGWRGPWPRTAAEEPAFWRTFWHALAEQHGLPVAAELETIGDFYHTCFVAFPDARASIAELRAAGLRLAVLTNFELPSIDRTLQHAGLDPLAFDALVSSAAVGVQKPDPRAYHAVTDALALPPAACLMVDDLPVNVAGARAAGLQALLLDRANQHPGEPARISSLLDIAGWLQAAKYA